MKNLGCISPDHQPCVSENVNEIIELISKIIDKGYAYIFGSNIGNGGCLILDLADPWNPIHVGTFDDYYIHDGYVRNDTLWASNILDGHFSVIDVSDKTNPI